MMLFYLLLSSGLVEGEVGVPGQLGGTHWQMLGRLLGSPAGLSTLNCLCICSAERQTPSDTPITLARDAVGRGAARAAGAAEGAQGTGCSLHGI